MEVYLALPRTPIAARALHKLHVMSGLWDNGQLTYLY